MAVIISSTDLPETLQGAESIALMIAGLNAKASRVAPCLAAPEADADLLAEAKLILVGVIKRWVEAGSGAVVQQTAGPWSQTIDTKQRPGWNLWPSEIGQLQELCKEATGKEGKAFNVDVTPTGGSAHQPWCALAFGATYCSCGAGLTADQYPMYEGGELS